MDFKELQKLYTALMDQEIILSKWEKTGRRQEAVNGMKNLLFNAKDTIEQCLNEYAKLEEERDSLKAALDDADAEYEELQNKVKKLTAAKSNGGEQDAEE